MKIVIVLQSSLVMGFAISTALQKSVIGMMRIVGNL